MPIKVLCVHVRCVIERLCGAHLSLARASRVSSREAARVLRYRYGTPGCCMSSDRTRFRARALGRTQHARAARHVMSLSTHTQSHRNERRQTTECGSWGVERLRVSEYGFTNVLSTHLARRRDDHDACGSFFAISFSFSIRGPCFCFWRMQMLGREHQHAPHRLHAPWRAWRLFGRRSEILYRYCSLYGFRLHSRFAKIE